MFDRWCAVLVLLAGIAGLAHAQDKSIDKAIAKSFYVIDRVNPKDRSVVFMVDRTRLPPIHLDKDVKIWISDDKTTELTRELEGRKVLVEYKDVGVLKAVKSMKVIPTSKDASRNR
jgi:hypothetical protein